MNKYITNPVLQKYNLALKILAGIVIIILIVSTIINSGEEGVDFDVFMGAAQNLLWHDNIYTAHYINNFQYFYSPLFALLLVPFTLLPIYITEALWLLFLFFLVYRIWQIGVSFFNITIFTAKQYLIWCLISVFLILSFILYNISRVQITIFIVWGTLESLKLINDKKYILGSLLLALVINIKIMPIVFVPYLLYNNNLKAFGLVILFSVIYIYLPAIFVGFSYNQMLFHSWLLNINPTNKVFELEKGNLLHSLNSTIPVFLTPTIGDLHLKRNFLNLDVATTLQIVNVFRLFFISLTIMFLKRMPFKNSPNKLHFFWEMGYILLITPLIFPHQGKYAYFYLFPVFIYLVYFFILVFKTKNQHRFTGVFIITILLSIIYTPLIGTDIIGGYAFSFLQFYRVMVICTMLLVPVLLYCNPEKINKMLTTTG